MFVVNVKEKGKQIKFGYIKRISPCTLKFQHLDSFQECIQYLKDNNIIGYTTKICDRNPIRKYDNDSTINLSTTIGGRP